MGACDDDWLGNQQRIKSSNKNITKSNMEDSDEDDPNEWL